MAGWSEPWRRRGPVAAQLWRGADCQGGTRKEEKGRHQQLWRDYGGGVLFAKKKEHIDHAFGFVGSETTLDSESNNSIEGLIHDEDLTRQFGVGIGLDKCGKRDPSTSKGEGKELLDDYI
ncbi:hypothetical protein Scep_019223 [Stephania cephalantha]|uniref:Uncharacterized protein n=1 Tax=Stephania cephalantha TaxID=152367 RepID=A0AAP0IAE8_9MAGN